MARTKSRKSQKPRVQTRQQPRRRAKTITQLRHQSAVEAVNHVVRDDMVVGHDELGQILLEHVNGQYDGFLPGFSISGNLNSFDRSSTEAIQSSVEQLYANSWLDAELVYFAIRKLLQEDKRIPHPVHVIPTLCPDEFERSIETLVHDKIVADKEKYKDIILLSEKDCGEDDPVHAENRNRVRLIKEKIEEILFNNHLDSSQSIKIFLQHILNKQAVDFTQTQQIVIPMRVGRNHFTVAVVHIENQKANISYKDSFNNQCPNDIRKPIFDFFKQLLGNNNVYFNNIKIANNKMQRNSYDCGVFAILNSLDMVRQNAGLTKFLPDSINREYLVMYRGFLFCLYESLGLKITLEPSFRKLLSQKISSIFEYSQKIFQNSVYKKQAIDQLDLLIDLIHNPENDLADKISSDASIKGRLKAINMSSELNIILGALRVLGNELKNIDKRELTPHQQDFVERQVQKNNNLLVQLTPAGTVFGLDSSAIQAVKKATMVTASAILMGLAIAKLPIMLALEGALASSTSLFIPIATAMFGTCFLLAVKLPNWLSSDNGENTAMVGRGKSLALEDNSNNLLEESTKVLTPSFEKSKQPEKSESNTVSEAKALTPLKPHKKN